jgi:phosphatidylinositol-3-phosphatase
VQAFKPAGLTALRILAVVLSGGALAPAAGAAAPCRTAATARVPCLRHVVVIVFENRSYGQVIGSAQARTFNRLARSGALLTRYYGVAHPSLPNYLAMVSGSTHGVTTDCIVCSVRARNLADQLDTAGRSWKVYAEGLPATGFAGPQSGRYVKRHNPFMYFAGISASPARRAHVVALTRLRGDVAAGRLPAFSLVVPDLCHDMHDCPVASGDAWLRRILPVLRPAGAAVFIVFDEGAVTDTAGGGGHIPALVVGPAVRAGARSSAVLTHYSLLRTIEDTWRLPHLGRSIAAAPITGIWRRPPMGSGP